MGWEGYHHRQWGLPKSGYGKIDVPQSLRSEFSPAFAPYYVGVESTASVIRSASTFRVGGGQIVVGRGLTEWTFTPFRGLLIPDRIQERREGTRASDIVIDGMTPVPGGGMIPSLVKRTLYDGLGREMGSRTFTLKSVSAKVDPSDIVMTWKDGARVEDHVNNLRLVMRGGSWCPKNGSTGGSRPGPRE